MLPACTVPKLTVVVSKMRRPRLSTLTLILPPLRLMSDAWKLPGGVYVVVVLLAM